MRRKSIVITSALAFSLLLSGCGAGLNAATTKISRVTDGNEITIRENGSEIRVVNLTLVDTQDGAAVVVATIIFDGHSNFFVLCLRMSISDEVNRIP
jgi:ABC-type Fe3+-citrate transport system substrate-binding protein